MINTLEFPRLSPTEILAAEEVLLDAAEAGDCGETLSFWESPDHFVVLGYGNKVATETNQSKCEQLGIPILRRISGGGTVLQGPGVLNYCLVLHATANSPLGGISSANQFIMERNADALSNLLNRKVEVQGHTDLAIEGRKFSGNAQRRKRAYILFHGAILLRPDMELLSSVLPMPTLEPQYRSGRSHSDFLTQLNCPTGSVKQALRAAWSAVEEVNLDQLVQNWRDDMKRLVAEKYSRSDWNYRI